jgi:hypothetical protein
VVTLVRPSLRGMRQHGVRRALGGILGPQMVCGVVPNAARSLVGALLRDSGEFAQRLLDSRAGRKVLCQWGLGWIGVGIGSGVMMRKFGGGFAVRDGF